MALTPEQLKKNFERLSNNELLEKYGALKEVSFSKKENTSHTPPPEYEAVRSIMRERNLSPRDYENYQLNQDLKIYLVEDWWKIVYRGLGFTVAGIVILLVGYFFSEEASGRGPGKLFGLGGGLFIIGVIFLGFAAKERIQHPEDFI